MTIASKRARRFKSGAPSYEIWSLPALGADKVARLPYSFKILLENLLRFEDGINVTAPTSRRCSTWDPQAQPVYEIAFTPARVIMQDFTGVPVHRRSGRDARSNRAPRRRRRARQPAQSRRAGHRPLRAGGPVRHAGGARRQHRASSSAAMASATRSCAGARPRSAISRWCRRTPASSTRSTSSISAA